MAQSKLKIIVISDLYDVSTNKVISWLALNKNVEITRINNGLHKLTKELVSKEILESKASFWIRRYPEFEFECPDDFRKYELLKFEEFIHGFIQLNFNSIGSFLADKTQNKLLDLERAKKHGLRVPLSYVVSNNKEFESIKDESEKWITKSLFNNISSMYQGHYYSGGFPKIIDDLPELISLA